MSGLAQDEVIAHLNDLISIARDGEEGYRDAGARVEDTHLKSVFDEYAKQRAGFVRELQAEVKRLGGEPTESGSIAAAVHRGWLDVKAALTGGGAHAIVAACETGEDTAEASFERVVNLDISGETRAVVEKQWKQIREAHQRMKHLKKET